MTFLEQLMEDNPSLSKGEIESLAVYRYCPSEYGYEKVGGCGNKTWDECRDCWNREMPNTERKEDTSIKGFTDDLLNQGYTKGINYCIDYIRKLFTIGEHTRKELFGCREIRYIIDGNSADVIIAKLKAYEDSQKIEVGDVVKWENKYIIVTYFYNEERILKGVDCDGQIYSCLNENVTKTGKHIDIQSILNQIGE